MEAKNRKLEMAGASTAAGMPPLTIIKIGGNVVDDEAMTATVLEAVAAHTRQGHFVIMVHGGGKAATRLAETLGIPQTLVEGRRITDAATLDVALMVYAGALNTKLVAGLQALGCNAMGLTGADGGAVKATRRPAQPIDFGYVGDVEPKGVNTGFLISLLTQGITPVFCALTHDGRGQMLNTNADTLAQVIAIALGGQAQVQLIYLFEKKGVLANAEDDDSIIESMNTAEAERLISLGVITAGMIPKIRNATLAISKGVSAVLIGHPAALASILNHEPHACTRIQA